MVDVAIEENEHDEVQRVCCAVAGRYMDAVLGQEGLGPLAVGGSIYHQSTHRGTLSPQSVVVEFRTFSEADGVRDRGHMISTQRMCPRCGAPQAGRACWGRTET